MTNTEFARFCLANEPNRFEPEANGEIPVIPPSGSKTGKISVGPALDEWATADGKGVAFEPNDGLCYRAVL